MKVLYCAGKMRGLPQYNAPLFDEARDVLSAQGYVVVSPVDLDRAKGFDHNTPESELTSDMVREFFSDSVFHLITQADAIVLLPGWKKSRGAKAELACAEAIGIPAFVYEGGQILPLIADQADGELMEEVVQITTHDRQSQYGSPNSDFSKVAQMWSAIFGYHFRPTDVALAMMCLKISRLSHAIKVDSLRDVAGYARCAYQIYMESERSRAVGNSELGPAAVSAEEVQEQSGRTGPTAGDQTDSYPVCGT